MQLLANENFPLDVVETLRSDGHSVAWIRADAPGGKDHEIVEVPAPPEPEWATPDEFQRRLQQAGALPQAKKSRSDR